MFVIFVIMDLLVVEITVVCMFVTFATILNVIRMPLKLDNVVTVCGTVSRSFVMICISNHHLDNSFHSVMSPNTKCNRHHISGTNPKPHKCPAERCVHCNETLHVDGDHQCFIQPIRL